MVLGKLPVSGRPTNLDYGRARAYCARSRCGWGLYGLFSLLCHFSFFSLSLGDGPISTEILSQRANQPNVYVPRIPKLKSFWKKDNLYYYQRNTVRRKK